MILFLVYATKILSIIQAIFQEVANEPDRTRAFGLSGVAYVEWAAYHPELYRVIFDPHNLDFAQTASDVQGTPTALDQMETFWTDLATLLSQEESFLHEHPLMQELSGRAMAHGLASMFVTGVFESLGVTPSQARAIASATMGVDLSKDAQ